MVMMDENDKDDEDEDGDEDEDEDEDADDYISESGSYSKTVVLGFFFMISHWIVWTPPFRDINLETSSMRQVHQEALLAFLEGATPSGGQTLQQKNGPRFHIKPYLLGGLKHNLYFPS